MAPRNTEELIVWYAILGTWPAYLTGTLYVVAPVIGWLLFFLLIKRCVFDLSTGPESSSQQHKPVITWIACLWVVGMLFMEVALIGGLINHHFGLGTIIKSTIGWAKGWALFAIFILIGGLNIRSELVIRACCLVCIHTLLWFPIAFLAWVIGFQQVLFTSPVQVVGGPGPEFFQVRLYEIDPSSGWPRWRLFTPWAPALGMVANTYFVLCLFEKNTLLKYLSLFSAVLMVLISFSRLGIIVLLGTAAAAFYLSLLAKPVVLWLTGVSATLVGVAAPPLLASVDVVVERFRSARAGSSRVRSALAEISLARWREEAPWLGHGVMERGPHLVEYMMIGSHHTWFGLLYVKGIVGFLSLAIPLLVTFIYTWWRSLADKTGRMALSVILILFAYSFGENLEILVYLFWPGLLIIGIACARARPSDRAQNHLATS